MEVFFADVAQGSAAVVLLGDRRALVIDCGGRQSRTVIELLSRLSVESIPRLVVSHNHDDHSAGAAALLTAFRSRVEQVWMLHDTVLVGSLFWKRVNEEVTGGRLRRDQLVRLERRNTPGLVYNHGGVRLAVLAPDLMANVAGVQAANPNATSGILVLQRGQQQIVFSGDSTISEWQVVHALRPQPITCLLATVPHHGGKVWGDRRPGEDEAGYTARVGAELDWLYTSALRPRVGVISVGTTNSHKHPRPEVVDALRRNGTTPICTQMTRQCEPALEDQRRRALPLVYPGKSTPALDRNDNGRSRNVACAGTIVAEITVGRTIIHRLGEHQGVISDIPHVPGQGPLCRR